MKPIPRAELVLYNALVDGGLFRRWAGRELSKAKRRALTSTEFNLGIDYGVNLSWKRLGLSICSGRMRSFQDDNAVLSSPQGTDPQDDNDPSRMTMRIIILTTEDLPDQEFRNISLTLGF